jgi:hypothetical protein
MALALIPNVRNVTADLASSLGRALYFPGNKNIHAPVKQAAAENSFSPRQRRLTMKQMKHWQDPVNGLVGVWLILSPWVLGFQSDMTAMANAVIIGILLLATALGAIFVPRAWEEWTETALGVWLAISPWALGYSALQNATISAVVSGVIVAVLALWVLSTDKDYAGWLNEQKAQ